MEKEKDIKLFNDEYLNQLHDTTSVKCKVNVQFLQSFLMLKKISELQLLLIIVYYFNKTVFNLKDMKPIVKDIFNDINNYKSDTQFYKSWNFVIENFFEDRGSAGYVGYIGNKKANSFMAFLLADDIGENNFVLTTAHVKNFDMSLAVIKNIKLFSLIFVEEYLKMRWESSFRNCLNTFLGKYNTHDKLMRDKRKKKNKVEIPSFQKNFNIASNAFRSILEGKDDVIVHNEAQASIVKELDNKWNQSGYSSRFFQEYLYGKITHTTIRNWFIEAVELGIIEEIPCYLNIRLGAYLHLNNFNNNTEKSSSQLHAVKGGKTKLISVSKNEAGNSKSKSSPSSSNDNDDDGVEQERTSSLFARKLPSIKETISSSNEKEIKIRQIRLKSKRSCKLKFDLIFDKFGVEDKLKEKFVKKGEKKSLKKGKYVNKLYNDILGVEKVEVKKGYNSLSGRGDFIKVNNKKKIDYDNDERVQELREKEHGIRLRYLKTDIGYRKDFLMAVESGEIELTERIEKRVDYNKKYVRIVEEEFKKDGTPYEISKRIDCSLMKENLLYR